MLQPILIDLHFADRARLSSMATPENDDVDIVAVDVLLVRFHHKGIKMEPCCSEYVFGHQI